ncbi:MAG: DUF2946 family protein [Betaproteobacteria bacterium]
MKRRCRLAVTFVTLAMHLLAPAGAYAARPAAESSDYCSAATRADARSGDVVPATSGVPAPPPGHAPHSHCPSCLGVFAVVAIPPAATPFVVTPRSLDRAPTGAPRAVIAAQPALLPPQRGPPSALS